MGFQDYCDYYYQPQIVDDTITAPRFAQPYPPTFAPVNPLPYSPDPNVALLLLRVQHLEEELSKIKEYLKGDDGR